ncbi:MAG TPA: alpha/beta fold hydrolase [bacterium]|nr:alpha/beta fold hydrolase [bacterium]
MATLNRGGVQLYYEVHGAGPVVLLTHGFSATSQMWRGQVQPLSARHRLLLWDMRGHGRSDSPEDGAQYSEEATVADMAALLDAAEAPQAIVGGLSLGGYMSLAFARAYPHRVRALLIVDTGPGFKNDAAREEWNEHAEATAQALHANGLEHLKVLSPERATSTHRSAAGLVHAARGMLTQRDARVIQSLPNIRVPTLIIVGGDDKPFLNASTYMAGKIPGAQLVVLPKAGHASNMDQPQAFNTCVTDFLAQVEQGQE